MKGHEFRPDPSRIWVCLSGLKIQMSLTSESQVHIKGPNPLTSRVQTQGFKLDDFLVSQFYILCAHIMYTVIICLAPCFLKLSACLCNAAELKTQDLTSTKTNFEGESRTHVSTLK